MLVKFQNIQGKRTYYTKEILRACPVEKLTVTYQNVNPYEEANNELQRLNPRIGTMNDILYSKPTP
jgi:hypothetical protein